MKTTITSENNIQAEVEHLRTQFPQTKDLYRETCVLLFFRYGITPTANKLYSLVRKGSMSAPANALDEFWKNLREKSRVRIESPDIPEVLRVSTGELISSLWRQAQEAASNSFVERIEEIAEQGSINNHLIETTNKENHSLKGQISILKKQIETSEQKMHEIERMRLNDINALTELEISYKSLRAERDLLAKSLEISRGHFTQDLEKLNESLKKAEDHYRMLEKKSMLELDNARQNTTKLKKENTRLLISAKSEQEKSRKEITAIQSKVSELREKVGILTGRLSELNKRNKETDQKLKSTEKQLATKAFQISPKARRHSNMASKRKP